jgi:hypothetical protein
LKQELLPFLFTGNLLINLVELCDSFRAGARLLLVEQLPVTARLYCWHRILTVVHERHLLPLSVHPAWTENRPSTGAHVAFVVALSAQQTLTASAAAATHSRKADLAELRLVHVAVHALVEMHEWWHLLGILEILLRQVRQWNLVLVCFSPWKRRNCEVGVVCVRCLVGLLR